MIQLAKHLATILFLAAAAFTIVACGSGKKTIAPVTDSLTSGNWLLLEDSVIPSTGFGHPAGAKLGGALAASGGTVSALLVAPSGGCFPAQPPVTPVRFTGTTATNTINLTYAADGQTMVIAGTINPGSNFEGTYTESGIAGTAGTCIPDNGTVYGTFVPSLTGNWTGTLPGRPADIHDTEVLPTVVTATFTQAAAASSNGSFALSGTIVLANATLFNSGSATLSIDPTASSVQGDAVALSASSADGTMSLAVTTTTLPNPTTATAMTIGGYTITGDLNTFSGPTTVGTIVTLSKP